MTESHRPCMRAMTSGRRSGGTVLGGCRRCGSTPSSSRVAAATAATASSNATSVAADGCRIAHLPDVYCRAAASPRRRWPEVQTPQFGDISAHIRLPWIDWLPHSAIWTTALPRIFPAAISVNACAVSARL